MLCQPMLCTPSTDALSLVQVGARDDRSLLPLARVAPCLVDVRRVRARQAAPPRAPGAGARRSRSLDDGGAPAAHLRVYIPTAGTFLLDFTGMAVAALFGRYLDEDGRVGPSHEGMHEGAPAGGRRARPRPPPGSVIRTVLRRAANVTGRPVRRRPEPGTFNPRRRAPASYGRWSPCCWSVTSTSWRAAGLTSY
jgi:hypothetical protein